MGNPLSRRDNREPLDSSKVAVTGYQRRSDGESGRGHPEVIFVKREAAPLPGNLHAGIVIASTRGDWLACQRREQLPGFQLKLGPALSRRQSFQAEQNLATGDRTHNNLITGSNGGEP